MSEKTRSEKLLEDKQVKPTAMRLLVAQEFLKRTEAKSLHAIEEALPTADKVTIYRTVKTFMDNDIVHAVMLPDGQTKYALCNHAGHLHHVHPHFTCKKCGQTQCLQKTQMHLEYFPKGFEISESLLSFSGYCPECIEKYKVEK